MMLLQADQSVDGLKYVGTGIAGGTAVLGPGAGVG